MLRRDGKNPLVSYRGRLAPTPSGYLHLGHAQTFFVAHLRAKAAGGTLILRHEDLDRARCKAEFVEASEEDLQWLGIKWQEGPYFQSRRMPLYAEALEKLKKSGRVYACACSRKDIQQAQQAPHQGDDEPLYPGTCRHKAVPESAARSWRFRVPDGRRVEFEDRAQGPQSYLGGRDFSDFVVWRPDLGPSYQLACAVDDGDMAITEVVRGLDLLPSTARQILLLEALDYPLPGYYHCPLVCDEQGRRLAKRSDALALRTLRARGEQPDQILARFVIR